MLFFILIIAKKKVFRHVGDFVEIDVQVRSIDSDWR